MASVNAGQLVLPCSTTCSRCSGRRPLPRCPSRADHAADAILASGCVVQHDLVLSSCTSWRPQATPATTTGEQQRQEALRSGCSGFGSQGSSSLVGDDRRGRAATAALHGARPPPVQQSARPRAPCHSPLGRSRPATTHVTSSSTPPPASLATAEPQPAEARIHARSWQDGLGPPPPRRTHPPMRPAHPHRPQPQPRTPLQPLQRRHLRPQNADMGSTPALPNTPLTSNNSPPPRLSKNRWLGWQPEV
jgi:hypothetical protein